MTVPIGIHDIALATGHYAMDLAELARHNGVDVNKYYIGLGQTSQTVPATDEDIVTMAAAAAKQIVAKHGVEGIRTILFATETGIDQSKAAAVYVQDLIGLPAATRAVELKQACYGGTSALQLAAGIVARDPEQRVLVIASDIAKYDVDSGGESTQGAAAVAMLVSAHPDLAILDETVGLYTANVQDFWRPNYRSTPLVDGKLSVGAYLEAVEQAWKDYEARGGRGVTEFAGFCYHQPFTKMAYKAHTRLLELKGIEASTARLYADLAPTTIYNRAIGNSYTASLFVGLVSLLDHSEDLDGKSVALFSYGSGCVAELFSVTMVPGYRKHLRTAENRAAIARREPISYEKYRALRNVALPEDGTELVLDETSSSPFRLTAIAGHSRIYGAARAQ
ncbi:hydroxymethylglutaryl-CoA synthase [Nocardia brasiliensis]|uniref:hydroxymethylglutaryl-CoA synthase n=1 Tax=Nocardia brasiliensis TaxID=37326 RepID=UPI0018950924|nr:hydroxymethylglutaryl-CoA synthase [Nocardia brasiliensis]MBF6130266.1 hydroxymethylglutaryl-CoA synthase [Nocardia brasiliensis]MBF6543550.1 hydroxymethylglutaryl-CoA synthase [Nocardia brasiliensis]